MDQEYEKKFNEMQKYLPFLQKIIEKLKVNNNNDPDNPRKAQLQKMEMLHGLLTSKGKKLKMETLLKCEGVLIKLHTKMEKSNTPNSTLTVNKSPASSAKESIPKVIVNTVPIEIVDITGPSSPPASPQTMEEPTRPIEIPTERRSPLTVIETTTTKATKSTYEDTKNVHRGSKQQNQQHHHRRHHRRPENNNNNKSRFESSVEKLHRSCELDTSTSSRSTSSSHISEYRDTSLEQFRNPDRDHDHERSSWQLKHKTDNNNQSKPLHLTTERVSSDSAYSPEESWDEITKVDTKIHKSKNISETATNDLLNDSVPPPNASNSTTPATYDNIIFKYKKRENDMESPNQKDKTIFARLGGKVADSSGSRYQNFSINVVNDRMKASKKDHSRKTTPAKTGPPLLRTNLPQPPLADVLKSPPLSANDISQLLDETIDMNVVATESFTTNSISSIGTRRPAKTASDTAPPTTPAATSLDMVRKKLAMISGGININDGIISKNSPQFNDSPASPPPPTIHNIPSIPKSNSTHNERIALKYHPHPRIERDSVTTTTIATAKANVVPAPFNVLPAINHFDPRLKKAAAALAAKPIPSLLDLPITQHSNFTVPKRNDTITSFNSCNNPRNMQPFSTGKDNYNRFESHPPPRSAAPPPASKSFKNTNNSYQNNSPEECWDTDPEDSIDAVVTPIQTSTPNLTNADPRKQTPIISGLNAQSSPLVESKKPQSSPHVQAKKPQKGGYSSEENWDSDPETPVTPAPQPNVTPQANFTTQREPISEPVAKLITLIKSDPRLQNSKTTQQSSFTERHANTSITKHQSTGEYWDSKTKSTTSIPPNSLNIPNLSSSPNHQHSSNSNRFSALLKNDNDKTERQKYFESKKQKHMEPRTYAEFKKAKARAAAEEASRKATNEGSYHKENKASSSSATPNKQTIHQQTKESKVPISNVTQKESDDKTSTTKPSLPASNLDKLYRSANFTTELPKAMNKFKIPKKQNPQTEEKVVNEKKDENVAKDDKSVDLNDVNVKSAPKKSEIKKEKSLAIKTEKTTAKIKEESVAPLVTEKRSVESLIKEKLGKLRQPISEAKAEGKQPTVKEIKKVDSVETKVKPINNSEESKIKPKKELHESSDNIKVSKAVDAFDGLKKKTAEEKEQESELKKQASPPVDVEETKAQTEAEKIDINIESPSKSKTNDMQIREIPLRGAALATSPTPPVLQPQRILRRRCTMIAYASAPEVDKEKIHAANALLFEDLQEREKLKRKAAELEKLAQRRSKHLADMFQKTDDNCTVSTQNIIIGKRRTRTTVNFNEIQQAQAVFKHIKPKEPKSENTNTAAIVLTTANSNINVTTAESKKVPSVNKKSTIKGKTNKNEKEDQSCTVSSTTSSLLTDDTPTFSGRKSRNSTKSAAQKEEETLDNEPSSSAKSTNPTPTPFDEDNQELLEGFMKDMFKPNANTKFVLNLLSQILKPKQLQQVKKIVESAAKAKEAEQQATVEQQPTINHDNDDVEDDDEEEEVESVTSEATQEQTTRHTAKNEVGQPKDVVAAAPKKPTPKNKNKTYKKKNELDRLNEDVRDMFISQGVITATGRRMCTLAAAAEAGIKTDDTHVSGANANNKKTDEKIGNKKIKSEIKDVTDVAKSVSTPLRIRKSKVVISPLNLSNVRRSLRVKGTDNVVEDDNKETINNEKPNNETVKTATSEIFKPHSPERKMPVLKPNTPIKLSDEEQLEEIEEKLKTKTTTLKKRKVADQQLKPTKLCPKSKQTAAVVMESDGGDNAAAGSDDSDEDIQLSHLRKRLKSSSKNSDEDDDVDEGNDKDSNLKANVEKQKSIIGNTNSHWHSQSKYAQWCVICDAKFTHIALHYKVQHNNSEYYSSRIAPNILQQYKQGKLSSPIFGTCRSKQKNLIHWFYRCPFCLQHNRNLIRCWVEHFSKHTGEYLFECSKCHKAGNGPALIEKHIESNQCAGASVIRHQYPMNQKLIKAHICHLCNYLQLYRINLERHYIEQHKCDPDRVTVLGYSINLLNTDGVEVVDAKKASEMEIAAIEKYTRESLIIVDDDDDDVDQKLLISKVEKQNVADASEVHKTSAVQLPPPVEKENNEKIKLTEIPNVVLDKITCENLKTVDCKVPNVIKDLQDLNDEKSSAKNDKPVYFSEHKNKQVINTEKLEQSSTNNTDGLKQIDEIEDLEKMIADVQEEVLAYAAKAEAEEKAREEALRSNIFTTSTNRNNTDSPTIDCLTQSLRTIEQEEQLQQQKIYTAQKTQQLQLEQSANTAVQRTPVMSIADRLSQRFKDIKVRSFIDKTPDIEPLLPSEQTAAAESTSVNTSISDDIPNLVIADDIENENFVDEAVVNDENMTDQDPDSEEDDGDWEDIEISESAPSANTSSISAGSSCASATNKEKQKKKKVYQSLTRFYSSNKKGNCKAKKNTNFVSISASVSGKKQRSGGLPEKHNQESTNDNAPQLAELIAEKQRPLIHNLADLLPDSPCNDPMELVPELAPNEPLQDLNDISALLEANFSSIDAQNILQQLDMPLTANSICINVEGQQQSIQDALDFVTEQQQRGQAISLIDLRHINEGDTTTINPNTLQVINRIQNLGYSKNLDAGSYITKFYCLSKNCSFLYSNESIGLENHYLSEHPQIKWNGFCSMCKQQFVNDVTSDEALPITQEFRHMIEQHVDVAMEDPSDENSTTDDNESKPRIKLRRLTGDCLSSTTPTKALTPEIIDSPTPCKDLINMTLTDLLNAEPRPLNLKTRPEIAFIPINKINNPSQIEESVATPVAAKPMPLFTNIGKEFAITSVSSANMEIIPINNTTSTQQIQISNVVSLSDSTDIANTVETDCNTGGSMSSLPKISNVCSLNSRVARQKSNAFNAATLWKEQIESDRIELAHAAEESLEVSRILQTVPRCRSPPTDKLGELLSSALREDSPTVVAEILPTATSTSGDFLITQTVSAQYVDNDNETASTEPQLGFNISIASTTMSSLTAGNSSSPIVPDNSAVVSDLESPCALEQFRCMGTRCPYQTRVVVAMMEHLRFHERRNFSTDHQYLRCSLCAHSADSIESYFQHAQDQHSQQLGIGVSSSSNANTCALTQKIQNILRNNIDNRSIGDGSSAKRATTPSAEPSYKQQLEQTIKEMVASTGLAESKVFRCPIKGCTTSLCETSFHKHLIYHLTTLGIMNVNNYSYKCPHCTAVYHRPTGIKAHIKNHARHSVFCYMCTATTSSTTQMLKHFCEKHWKVSNIITAPLLVLPNTTEIGQVTYLLAHDQQISPTEVQQFGEKLISELQRKKAASKTHFGFNEINLLPIQPIFQNEVHCAECNYKTKVRTNMYRHLQMHKTSSATSGGAYMHVASVDPVNPVPCLNTNERHFDKMCNLASSSLVTGNSSSSTTGGSIGATAIAVKPPFKLTTVYISESRRFTCGVPDCQYLTVSDDIFRSHLSALHSNLQQYLCPFCKDEISVRTLNIERIMQHLRFHSQKIYQCEECDYLHYMKNFVERHIQEKHVTQRVNLITHDRKLENVAEGIRTMQLITGKKFKDQFATRAATAADVPNNSSQSSGSLTAANSSLTAAANTKNKWECDICKHRTMTYNQMISHASVQHACKQQYQCVHCQFGATQLAHIMTHIDEKHPTKTREARYVFHKINSTPQEKEADTRPLWQRDDPKRIRHIRGILMEDEEESEQYRKLLCLDGDEVDDDDDGLENSGTLDTAATTQSNESILSNFEYACHHCDYKSSSFTELKYEHWQRMHNVIARDAKPFYFRLLTSLKCAECLEFYGDYNELERHLQDFHKTRSYLAADGRHSEQLECGYCNFKYLRTEQLVQHYNTANHQPQDIKTFTIAHLAAIKFLGTPQTYNQCMICNELFANRMSIVAHERAKHKNDPNFSFNEIKNTIIYRCPLCFFSSVDEMTTLRHMIDHYGQFKRCYFCYESQASFSSYMQHCYTEHREEVKKFSEIYTINDITNYLQLILVIFPNGLIMNKRNLANTKYGRDNSKIRDMYKEICKIAQQPPIPRLSIARLVARKSVEASRNNSPNPDNEQQIDLTTDAAVAVQFQAKKITKRRQTVAFGSNESANGRALLLKPNVIHKKRKISESTLSNMLLTPPTNTEAQLEPYSFYGKKAEPLDLSKIYTKVAIAGLDTQLTINNFKGLFKIDAQVVVEKLKLNQINTSTKYDNSNEYRHIKKACPASLKHKYV